MDKRIPTLENQLIVKDKLIKSLQKVNDELLKALKESEFFIRNSIEQKRKHQDSLTIVRQAIAKAEGRL